MESLFVAESGVAGTGESGVGTLSLPASSSFNIFDFLFIGNSLFNVPFPFSPFRLPGAALSPNLRSERLV